MTCGVIKEADLIFSNCSEEFIGCQFIFFDLSGKITPFFEVF
jgi:hypothetical protein